LKSIATRADSLSRFMQAYARLAKLPPPQKEELNLGDLIRRVASLETRMTTDVRAGRELSIRADGAQLEQLLINIMRNAADASLETQGKVAIGWREAGECVEVFVQDEGQGIMNSTNLFVPFFTTKPTGRKKGMGLGLTVARKLVELHHGILKIGNREGGGTLVTVILKAP